MKFIITLATSLATIALTSCKSQEKEYAQIISGRIVAETAHTFTLLSQDRKTILPKSTPVVYGNRIFIEDSVIVRYRELKNETKIDDIILISHKNDISNVAELFVGSWSDSTKTMTLNADMTTSEQEKWTIDGKKMLIRNNEGTKEYNIINVDDSQMTLCHEDQTIHMRRSYNN